MRTVLRDTLLPLAATLLAATIAAAAYASLERHGRKRPEPATFPVSSERLARGERLYLLAGCDDCHAPRDFTHFAGPVPAGASGRGGMVPGTLATLAPSIRPERLSAWNDAEIARAIREGVRRDGRLLNPAMPYSAFARLSYSDLQSLVVYLRRPTPQPAHPQPDAPGAPRPDGAYLAAIGRCATCHTRPGGAPYAGGREFHVAGGRVASANLTPDCYQGIGRWSTAEFVDRFHRYRGYAERGAPAVGPGGVTVMPWLRLARLPAADLEALYAHLREQEFSHPTSSSHIIGTWGPNYR